MTRLLHPDDVRQAVQWYIGPDPLERSQRPRNVKARLLYWAALRTLGFSYNEIAETAGMDHSSVKTGLARHPQPDCYVNDVLKRARKQVAAE